MVRGGGAYSPIFLLDSELYVCRELSLPPLKGHEHHLSINSEIGPRVTSHYWTNTCFF